MWSWSIQLLLKLIRKFYRDEDKGTTSAVHDHEVKVETKKTIRNRNKRQKQRAIAKLKAKESESKTTVGNTSAAAPTQSDSDSIIDVLTSGDCLCCGNTAQKICAKCQKNSDQISYYCSMNCWDEHLSVHKQICSLVKPQKMFPNSSFRSGILLLLEKRKNRAWIVMISFGFSRVF